MSIGDFLSQNSGGLFWCFIIACFTAVKCCEAISKTGDDE